MSKLIAKASTETVVLSFWVFAIWWVLILGVHVITCVYNALYAYCYWELKGTFINMYLESLQIGMPPPYHHRIAIVHAVMSAIHAFCIVLMLGGSLWQRSLAFTSRSSCVTGPSNYETKSPRTESVILRSFSKVYSKLSDRRGICGVNGNYFHAVLIFREIIETALQTVQAYRMGMLLPRSILNRFYVILLVINCWSSVLVYSVFFRQDEARRRFACIVLDCVLDLVACMGVELMILLSYAAEYDANLRGFDDIIWYNDEWVARALNEFQMVVVVSWSDLASRSIFSLGLVITTMSMKKLLQHQSIKPNRVSQTAIFKGPANDKIWGGNLDMISAKRATMPPGQDNFKRKLLVKQASSYDDSRQRTRCGRWLLCAAHLMFAVWGALVLALHISASVQPTLPQCLMQVRPWAKSRPACYLAGLDCHTLGISGKKEEVADKWSEFDSSTVVQLLIRHCPALEVPDVFNEFHRLRGIKVYNTTIKEWGESAAFTSTLHPRLASLYIARTNFTDGVLPAGFQSPDFPQGLYDFEICGTNIRELPDDLDTKWPAASLVQIEYSQLTSIPSVLWRMEPLYLAVTGNPITEIPPEVFEVPGMLYLGISEMNIHELPQNVTQLSSGLSWIYIGVTEISFFWAWVDELVERMQTPPWLAGASTYCTELEMLQNDTIDAFSVPMSPEYSTMLMDPSETNRKVIIDAVNCDIRVAGLFYPIDYEDGINAISTPLPLVKPTSNIS